MHWLVLILVVVAVLGCRSRTAADPAERQRVVAALARMAEADQNARLTGAPWAEIDRNNVAQLKQLLARHRWFTISEFGAEADRNAWLIVQHADFDPELQARVLAILEQFVPRHETSAANYAFLYDRLALPRADGMLVLVDGGAPATQRFGTQGLCTGPGQWEPFPIADPDHVDARRKAYGLTTFEDERRRNSSYCR